MHVRVRVRVRVPVRVRVRASSLAIACEYTCVSEVGIRQKTGNSSDKKSAGGIFVICKVISSQSYIRSFYTYDS